MMDLKTCPFCGSEVELSESEDRYYGVSCPSCSARISYTNGDYSKYLTIRKFNKRTVDDKTEDRMKRRICDLIDESIEESFNKYGSLALKELKIKIKYMDMDV